MTSIAARPYPALTWRPELDGIRGIAVLIVIVSHWLEPTGVFEAGGQVGVTLFFVLSGFLITSIIRREMDARGDVSLVGFYARRILRLAPALAVVLVVYLAWTAALGLDRTSDVLAAAFYAGNLVQVSHGGMHELGHLWSLAVEEQFYIVWPLGLMAILRWAPRPALVVGVLAVVLLGWHVGLYLATFDWHRVYFATDTVAFALVAGAALALSGRSQPRLGALVGLGLLVVLALANHQTGVGAAMMILIVGPVAVLASLGLIAGASRVPWLAARPLVWLGGISYGLYLWHGLINGMLGTAYGLAWDLPARALAIPAAIAIAWLSRRYIEASALRLKSRIRSAPDPDRVGAGAAANGVGRRIDRLDDELAQPSLLGGGG